MTARANIRRTSLVVVTVIAMVAVLLPLCMALDCGMSPADMMGSSMLGFSSDCGKVMTSVAQVAIAPGSPQAFLLMLVAAFGVALVLSAPPIETRLVRVIAEDPPAPPDDPRGVRLII